ncbi:MAG: response regulator [Myxococcota bacterium]|nr:response regulator [Myxococcota bacterium]
MLDEELIKGSKVLIVDDAEADRALLNHYFKPRGYQVMMATSGREALEVLRSESNFALVVTDINMPDLDGIDLLKQVRYSRPNLPVIVSSGRDHAELSQELKRFNVNWISQKPPQQEVLDSFIEEALGKNHYGPVLRETINDIVLTAMRDTDKTLKPDIAGLPFLRFGPELLGDICVVVTIYGKDIDASLVMGGPMAWWNRIATGFLGKHATSTTSLYDCAGEFTNGIATKLRNYFLSRGHSSNQAPQYVIRSDRMEVMSSSDKAILVMPYQAVGISEKFFTQLHIQRKEPEDPKPVETRVEGEFNFF